MCIYIYINIYIFIYVHIFNTIFYIDIYKDEILILNESVENKRAAASKETCYGSRQFHLPFNSIYLI